jgi:hypothetical protein
MLNQSSTGWAAARFLSASAHSKRILASAGSRWTLQLASANGSARPASFNNANVNRASSLTWMVIPRSRPAASEPILSETSAPSGDGRNEREGRLAQDIGFLFSRARSCWAAVSTFLRTTLIRFAATERARYRKAKITLQQPTKGLTFIKASEGTWRGIAPGVMAKLLSFDPISGRTTTVLRFAPGTSYAPHRHTAVEELYVLEGGCRIAGREMRVGDYHRAEIGTVHHDTSTDEGCLLLVTSSPQNEMLR